MATSTKPRIKLPEVAKTGDIVEIKALIQHIMETGNRRDPDGKQIPRSIINTFSGGTTNTQFSIFCC